MQDTYLARARADAARALSLLEALVAPRDERTVISGPPEMTEATEPMRRRSQITTTVETPVSTTEDEALAWASAELRRLSAESPSGRVSGDAIAAVYRRVALWD